MSGFVTSLLHYQACLVLQLCAQCASSACVQNSTGWLYNGEDTAGGTLHGWCGFGVCTHLLHV